MPSINRIRVNNVKYNFGTQQYDDFTMRMYGKNTLYDLANGGGKSVLMLLLLQNLIPNCTLDDKQPIEKLFRAGCGNTTIHSLIEWKLDESEIKEGYKYMTTGFCARKAKDEDQVNEEKIKDTASIEYFNYCIFYREYNKNDIINLPLSEGNEKITYGGLRSYLKELSHKDMGLEIKVFDKKGEYQRFISGYGLHESHWEIIRGINKTEGHVRTYFETNYKTTRKVVEDLLIEEIIEKAFLTKTGRDSGEDTMAETLLDIKDKLAMLAKKKRDIANYDHQIELINVLEARVNSCMDHYEEHQDLSETIANIYETIKSMTETDDKELLTLKTAKEKNYVVKEKQKQRLENLKVTRDYYKVEEYREAVDRFNQQLKDNEERIKQLKHTISYKESINDFLLYQRDKKQLDETCLIIDNITNKVNASDEKLAVYAAAIKIREEKKLKNLLFDKEEIEKSAEKAETEQEYNNKLMKEAEITLAVVINNIKEAEDRIEELTGKIGQLSSQVRILAIGDAKDMYEAQVAEKEKLKLQQKELTTSLKAAKEKLFSQKYQLTVLETEIEKLSQQEQESQADAAEFSRAKKQFENIMTVYNVQATSELVPAINGRITGTLTETIKRQQEIEKFSQRLKLLKQGCMFGPSKGAQVVMDYISTRHGTLAMFGADYIAALDKETRKHVLEANPSLPYGVVTKEFEHISQDINLGSIDTGNETIVIYNMDQIKNSAIDVADNAVKVCRDKKYFLDEDTRAALSENIENNIRDLEQELELINEKVSTYQEDLAFAGKLVDVRYQLAEEKSKEIDVALNEKKDEYKAAKESMSLLNSQITEMEDKISKGETRLLDYFEDEKILYHIEELAGELSQSENRLGQYRTQKQNLDEKLEILKSDYLKWSTTVYETNAKKATIAGNIDELQDRWATYFEPYYRDNVTCGNLDINQENLESEFMALLAVAKNNAPDLEDKKKLREALTNSLERIQRTIEKRGIEISELEEEQELYQTEESMLRQLDDELARLTLISASIEQQQRSAGKALSKLEGSIEYAISNIENTYGMGSYEREALGAAEIETAISGGNTLLAELESRYENSVKAYESYYKQQGFISDLYKDVDRIININDIDVSNGHKLEVDKEKLRELFEESMLKFDRSRKNLDKAKNELLKFKGQTAETLVSMEFYEMAQTIRNDVIIPDNYSDAKALLDNLRQIIAYIKLEKERVEKGIEDMEAIKAGFEDQCIQRCMDVKTELEKLPKLSRITVDDEVIKMVDLSIPYVKEEFLKQHMSDYIDDIVKGADSYDDEKRRIRYIRDCLGLKKLFGVMVTDMNAIKLHLYKRERIKEQSRYLRYEEAVGSTGQSQGIYIQFLVSIINYISGMYSYGPEDSMSEKTIFIDNPFGAAKDIYIWEPIFAMLLANHVQLIVPARGATPAITGRFDVNYILGQQLVGKRQQTVVIDYTSKTDQTQVEYHDLSYEQASFDFI